MLGSRHYYNHSTDWETETQKLSDLHKIAQVVSGRTGFKLGIFESTACVFNHLFLMVLQVTENQMTVT